MSEPLKPVSDSIEPKKINPIIQAKPVDTINNCAAVIGYMAYFNESEASEPIEEIRYGGYLIYQTVIQALKYESGRAQS